MVTKSQPVLLLMEFLGKGDLQNFLRNRRYTTYTVHTMHPIDALLTCPRHGNVQNLETPSEDKMARMAADIADGMAYLERSQIVHRFESILPHPFMDLGSRHQKASIV